jgi:hypothetical protein
MNLMPKSFIGRAGRPLHAAERQTIETRPLRRRPPRHGCHQNLVPKGIEKIPASSHLGQLDRLKPFQLFSSHFNYHFFISFPDATISEPACSGMQRHSAFV